MQSFIINIPEEKVDFFLELAEMLDFEVLEIEEEDEEEEMEPEPESKKKSSRSKDRSEPESEDPFLDWEEERKNAKKNKY